MQDTSIEARSEQDSRAGEPPLSPPRPGPATVAAAAIEGMRPYQWLKNGLVFAPLAAAHRLTEWALLMDAIGAFVAFSLTASALYLVNDLKDAAADRAHPHKRNRPIASGRLPPAAALATTGLLIVAAAVVAGISSPLISLMVLSAWLAV